MLRNHSKEEHRIAFVKALIHEGTANSHLIVLSPDVGISTKAIEFKQKFPDRYISCGIAEANTLGIAAGLVDFGYVPVVALYAAFAVGKAGDQIINGIAYPNLNVKIIGTHGGINIGEDGPTHQSILDLNFFRAIPNFVVLAPSDSSDVQRALELALIHQGPVYIRLERIACSQLLHSSKKNEIGKSEVIREGHDATIIAIGTMVQEALLAADILSLEGISVCVINTFSVKPIDTNLISYVAQNSRVIITAEDHNFIGGLYSAISEVIASFGLNVSVKSVSVKDKFAESGNGYELRKKYSIDSKMISRVIKNELKNKKG